MSADDVRISEALESIDANLTMINVALDKAIKELGWIEVIATRLGGFTAFLEDYAKKNFD